MKRDVINMLTVLLIVVGWSSNALASDGLTIELFNGESFSIEGEREKPLYLKFWATWCFKCREQMPHLQSIYNKHRDKLDVVAVNICMDDSVEKIAKFKQSLKISVPIALDTKELIRQKMNVKIIPYSVLIDKKGEIVYRVAGVKGIDEAIEKLLKHQ